MEWLFPLVGALIGYLTNQLAIIMIFRPYERKQIGSIPLPFTPGLIPKDRKILANKIASTITTKLLTKEEFSKIFKKSNFKIKFLNSMNTILTQFIGPAAMLIPDNIRAKIEDAIYEAITKEIPTLVSDMELHSIIEDKINEFPIEKLEEIILSVTKKQLRAIAYLGGVIGFIIGLVQILLVKV